MLYVSFVTGPVAMAKDPLAEAGFYFDELNKLRVLEPDVSQKTSELKEECKEFVDSKHLIFCQVHYALCYIIHHKVLDDVQMHVILCRNWPVSEDSGRSD